MLGMAKDQHTIPDPSDIIDSLDSDEARLMLEVYRNRRNQAVSKGDQPSVERIDQIMLSLLARSDQISAIESAK